MIAYPDVNWRYLFQPTKKIPGLTPAAALVGINPLIKFRILIEKIY
jgi:hypothetical protein